VSVLRAFKALSTTEGVSVASDVALASCTTYRIGGPADLVAVANTYAGLVSLFRVLEAEQAPWVILGRGSNVLASDAGYRGCVVRLGSEFDRIQVEGTTISAGAGVLLARLVNKSLSEELSGLECCAGIPGTVGGALSMDAGSRHEWIGRVVRDLVTYRPGIDMRRYLASEIEWGYRWTTIPSDEIILEATFELTRSTKRAGASEMNRRLARRRATQPTGKPCCGSVFKNPGDRSVGAMLEGCSLKGYRVGHAAVSDRHANFVVNEGGARATDVLAIINHMHNQVQERYGVDLTPEVKFLGFEG
jgi:UDP-N-acetylmuramate dehydrogenase